MGEIVGPDGRPAEPLERAREAMFLQAKSAFASVINSLGESWRKRPVIDREKVVAILRGFMANAVDLASVNIAETGRVEWRRQRELAEAAAKMVAEALETVLSENTARTWAVRVLEREEKLGGGA